MLDHNTPTPLRYFLVGHQVETAYERGWAELSNGDLLQMGRRLALFVLSTNDWTRIRNAQEIVVDAISNVTPGAFVEIEIPAR